MHQRRHHPATSPILAVRKSSCRCSTVSGRTAVVDTKLTDACQSSRVVGQHCAAYACLHLPTERLLRMHQGPTSREYEGAIVPFCSSCVASRSLWVAQRTTQWRDCGSEQCLSAQSQRLVSPAGAWCHPLARRACFPPCLAVPCRATPLDCRR